MMNDSYMFTVETPLSEYLKIIQSPEIQIVIYIFVALFGLVFGSFANVLIYRIPLKLSFIKGRSFCPKCGREINWYDNIPILSYIILRGKCRDCGKKISLRYPVIELLGCVSAIASYAAYGLRWESLAAEAAAIILLVIAAIDIDTMEIPNGLVIALLVPAIAGIWLEPEVGLWSRLIGIAAVSVPMLLLALAVKGAFGGGDIKLVAAAGLLLGWERLVAAVFAAFILGGAYAVWLLARKKAEKGTQFAFGPFLAVGIALSLWWGNAAIGLYLGLWGL